VRLKKIGFGSASISSCVLRCASTRFASLRRKSSVMLAASAAARPPTLASERISPNSSKLMIAPPSMMPEGSQRSEKGINS
jgi:hypothetical protein